MALPVDKNLLKSLAVLGYNFGIHIMKAMVPRRKVNQAETFIEYFKDDNIRAFSPEDDQDVLSFETCVNCGICQAHCRVAQVSGGKFLGPVHMAACASRSQPEFFADADSIFRCAVCSQCEPACPEAVPISRIAIHMKSMIQRTRPDLIPEAYSNAAQNLEKHGNIYGEPKVKDWPKNRNAEYILFMGCRERRDEKRAGKLFMLMERLGISVTGIEEVCCGGVPRTMAIDYNGDLEERILGAGPEKLICVCPHCAETLRKSENLAEKIEVKHITEILEEKMPEGISPPGIEGPVAFHDPCYLARGCGIIEEPRKIMKSMGMELVEMNENGLESPCCGAGGGLELFDQELARQVAIARLEDARAAGAKTLATECLTCYHNLNSAAGEKSGVKVVLLTELAVQGFNAKA